MPLAIERRCWGAKRAPVTDVHLVRMFVPHIDDLDVRRLLSMDKGAFEKVDGGN